MPKRKSNSEEKRYFILIKKEGFSARGESLSGYRGALSLLDAGYWPLWKRTPNKNAFRVGDTVLVYIAGDGEHAGHMVAEATVSRIATWERGRYANYPLMLDDVPEKVLHFSAVKRLRAPIALREHLTNLSFISKSALKARKWGAALMGGVRRLTPRDYALLTTQ